MNAADPEPTQRDALSDLLRDIESLETVFADWTEEQRRATMAYRRAIEALNGEALKRIIRALKADPAALTAMKGAACDDVVYAVLRHHGLVKPSLNERVEAALQGLRPMLASHGGDVEVVRLEPPRIEVRFKGACAGCASSTLTFQAGVEKAIQEACPEITDVIHVRTSGIADDVRFVSPFALTMDGTWLPACPLEAIPDNGMLTLELGGQQVVLFRRGSAVTCYQNACAHLGLAIHSGIVKDGIITCPHHGFRYDLATGECLNSPEVQLQAHAVRVIGGSIEVRISR